MGAAMNFSEQELLKIEECFEGRAKWMTNHYVASGGRIEADKIRELMKKVLRFLENDS
jgi:hypothetical protein